MSDTPSGATLGLSLGQKLRYGAEAALFLAFMALFRVIGLDKASRLGGWIGRNIFPLLPPDRVARANLAAAFPEKSEDERNEIRGIAGPGLLARVRMRAMTFEAVPVPGSERRFLYKVLLPPAEHARGYPRSDNGSG